MNSEEKTRLVKKILFYRDVELLTPPKLTKPSKKNPRSEIREYKSNDILPWVTGKYIDTKKEKYFHIIYLGRIKVVRIIEEFSKIFKFDISQNDIEAASGETCFVSFIVNASGNPIGDSYFIAGFVYAIFQKLNNLSLSGFDKFFDDEIARFEERMQIPIKQTYDPEKSNNMKDDRESSLVLNFSQVVDEAVIILKKLKIEKLFEFDDLHSSFYCNTQQVKAKFNIDSLDDTLLKSFFQEDLGKIADLIKNSNSSLPKGLELYLSENEASPKIDLLEEKDEIKKLINPNLLLKSKWPSNPQNSLFLAQQCAVNEIIKKFSRENDNENGILGVNGPPGTGKTTILREVLTEIVVERATRIANMKNPEGLFTEIFEDVEYHNVTQLNESIASMNDGVVVASNNNAAVENISKEIPLLGQIDDFYLEFSDYFSEVASNMFKEECWGLISAKLGRKKNISDSIWPLLNDKPDEENKKKIGLKYYLTELNSNFDFRKEWEKVKKEYQSMLGEIEKTKNILFLLNSEIDSIPELIKKLKKQEENLKLTQEEINKIGDKKKSSETDISELTLEERKSLEIIKDYENTKPGFFQIIFHYFEYRKWNKIKRKYVSEYEDIKKQIIDFRFQLMKIEKSLLKCQKMEDEKNKEIKLIKNELNKIKNKIGKYKEKGFDIPDFNFINQDITKLHLTTLWMSKVLNELRSKLFLKALELHKVTMFINKNKILKNLHHAYNLFLGKNEYTITEISKKHIWGTFFFCIPLVSTTLASFPKLFNGIEKEQIGYLLIDEAGQATPQSAIGAIYRSQKNIVIGDPLQIEPIVTLPDSVIKGLLKQYKLPEFWSPKNTSAQKLADRATPKGTYIKGKEKTIWTGLPLRVHFRCDDPMFSISNKIAYNGQMVKYDIKRKSMSSTLPESSWFDINSSSNNGNIIPKELEFVKKFIEGLLGNYLDNIFIISPFRAVANSLKGKLSRTVKKSSSQIGTIHTFQGKETDIVIVVLGGDPKNKGAFNWASKKPNILNVAVSRAKRRLYIVGNYDLWSKEPHFGEMAKMLERKNGNEFLNEIGIGAVQ